MFVVTAKEILLWRDTEINKGGDLNSLHLLLDVLGGVSKKKFNLLKINPQAQVIIQEELKNLSKKWQKHLESSVPIPYLCKFCFWRDLKIEVSSDVLIPRSETELIIDIANELIPSELSNINFVDLGTGSGAIAIALALLKPNWYGVATDKDQNALTLAKKNFNRFPNKSNLEFYCGNWWNPLEKKFLNKLDLIISNPPYIPSKIFSKLPIDVKNFEPKLALIGGEDGLDHIKQIVYDAHLYIKKNGWIILENHFDQSLSVKRLLLENGFSSVRVINDFSGIGRFTIGRYK